MGVASTSEGGSLSAAEATARITSLTPAEMVLFKKASIYLSGGTVWSPNELRQEAIKRIVAGSRKWPRHLPAPTFLFGVMRSIAWANRRAQRRKPELTLVPRSDSGSCSAFDPRVSPEELLLEKEEEDEVKARVLALFEDDLVAKTLMEGMMEELEGQELRQLVGLSERDFASKRRLVRRRIDKAFPDGWKP